MQRIKISIAEKTLALLENKAWKDIKLNDIKGNNKNLNFKKKIDLLININRYFDYLLKQNLTSLEKSSTKDMLFEVLMARLDILNLYRNSIKKIIKHFLSQPQDFILLLPSFAESILQVATLSDINVSGIKGIAKIKSIFILYFLIIYTWNTDETSSLEKTMTTLDKYLSNFERLIKIIK